MKLITAKGSEFPILWAGVSTLDGALRFAVVESSLDEIHNTFKDPEKTATLTQDADGVEVGFEGFTDYRGFDKKFDGSVVVALNRGR